MSRLSALSHTCVHLAEMGNPVPMNRPGLFWSLTSSVPDHTLHRDTRPQSMFIGHPTLTTSSGKPGVPRTMVPANDNRSW